MHRLYEIFEVSPNGSPQRVTVVSGLETAKSRLHEVANHTSNECFAADVRTRQIVALLNVPLSKWRAAKPIFQISYDEEEGRRRAELLKSRGYRVLSVIGNEAARVALSTMQHYDLFLVGHAGPEEARQEIVVWLKAKYPRVKVLALNAANQEVPGADYNARQDGPETWLAIISREVAKSNPKTGQGIDRRHLVRNAMATPQTRKQLHALCHEHHIEMRLTEMDAQGEGGPTQTFAYACPQPDCGARYTPSKGYFIAADQSQPKLDLMPRVRCLRDGQPMYLAEVNPERRNFRLWRCPQCDGSRTNEEGLADSTA